MSPPSLEERQKGTFFLITEKAVLCKCLHLPEYLPITEVHSEFAEAEQIHLL